MLKELHKRELFVLKMMVRRDCLKRVEEVLVENSRQYVLISTMRATVISVEVQTTCTQCGVLINLLKPYLYD